MDFDVVKKNLETRGYTVSCFDTKEECRTYILNQVHDTTVGIGGSVSVREMGLFEELCQTNTVWWHNDPKQAETYGVDVLRQNEVDTPVYISSVNGLSQQGVIINIDGTGNRISSLSFGHDKIYLIVGKNKIAEDFEKTMWRVRNIAGPLNAARFHRNTPCVLKPGRCYDCQSPQRICNGILILERVMATPIEVLLVNEDLGY